MKREVFICCLPLPLENIAAKWNWNSGWTFHLEKNELSIFVKLNILVNTHLLKPQHFCKMAIVFIYSLFYHLDAFATLCSSKLFFWWPYTYTHTHKELSHVHCTSAASFQNYMYVHSESICMYKPKYNLLQHFLSNSVGVGHSLHMTRATTQSQLLPRKWSSNILHT